MRSNIPDAEPVDTLNRSEGAVGYDDNDVGGHIELGGESSRSCVTALKVFPIQSATVRVPETSPTACWL
jgi:hypothetical protein